MSEGEDGTPKFGDGTKVKLAASTVDIARQSGPGQHGNGELEYFETAQWCVQHFPKNPGRKPLANYFLGQLTARLF
jgi:hypothetical protein